MPVQGFTRLRRHQFGRQQEFGVPVAATRAYALSGTPDVDPSWTEPEVDAGSRDPVAPPYRGAPSLAASLSSPMLAYDDLPLLLCSFLGGGVAPTGSGTARTWHHDPASRAADEVDPFTYEFGDDVASDWLQLGDGIVTEVVIEGPEGLGPLTATSTWKFGSVRSTGSTDSPALGTVPTAGLSVDPGAVPVFLKDGSLRIAATRAGLSGGIVEDALHSLRLTLSQEVDEKRWANGAKTFDVGAYGPGKREISLELTLAKTARTVGTGSESDAWMGDVSVDRFVRLAFESAAEAEDGVPYSWTLDMPVRYTTRAEGEVGGNSVIVLTGRAWYDAAADSVLRSDVVCTLTEAQLGVAGS